MATTTVYAASSVSGGALTPNNAVGPVNNTWTSNENQSSWTHRWAMEPAPDRAVLSGNQAFSVVMRKTSSGNPTLSTVTIYSGGAQVFSQNVNVSVTSTSSQTYTFPAVSSALITDPNNVEVELSITAPSSGNPTTRSSVQIDAITWVVNYFVPEPINHQVSGSANAVSAATGRIEPMPWEAVQRVNIIDDPEFFKHVWSEKFPFTNPGIPPDTRVQASLVVYQASELNQPLYIDPNYIRYGGKISVSFYFQVTDGNGFASFYVAPSLYQGELTSYASDPVEVDLVANINQWVRLDFIIDAPVEDWTEILLVQDGYAVINRARVTAVLIEYVEDELAAPGTYFSGYHVDTETETYAWTGEPYDSASILTPIDNSTNKNVSGTAPAHSGVSGDAGIVRATVDHPVDGVVQLSSGVEGSPTTRRVVTGQASAISDLIGSVALRAQIDATITVVSDVIGAVSLNRYPEGTINALSGSSGEVGITYASVSHPASGQVGAVSAMAGDVASGFAVNSAVIVDSQVSGVVNAVMQAAGLLPTISTSAGSVQKIATVSGETGQSSTIQGAVILDAIADGETHSSSTAHGDVSLDAVVDGEAHSASTVSGAAGVEQPITGETQSTTSSYGSANAHYIVNGVVDVFSTVLGTTGQERQHFVGGQTDAVSTSSGHTRAVFAAEGTTDSTTVITGDLQANVIIEGLVGGSSEVAAEVFKVAPVSGVTIAESVVNGSARADYASVGSVLVESAVDGAAMGTFGIDGSVDVLTEVSGDFMLDVLAGTIFKVYVDSGFVNGELLQYVGESWRPKMIQRYVDGGWKLEPGSE